MPQFVDPSKAGPGDSDLVRRPMALSIASFSGPRYIRGPGGGSMKIISWNVNGIRAAHRKGFLEFFSREEPDILCVQETKAHKEQLDDELIRPLDSHSYFSSAERKGYSGVATFSFDKSKETDFGIGVRKFDSEGRIVVTKHQDFYVYNIYFPNGSSSEERHDYKQEFLKKINSHLKKRIKAGDKLVVLGDYNVAHKEIDVYDPERLSSVSGFLPEEREWFDAFLNLGFVDTYRHFNPELAEKYTWWSYREMARPANRGWRLDYICITENLMDRLKSAEIMDGQEGSDHCPIVIELEDK